MPTELAAPGPNPTSTPSCYIPGGHLPHGIPLSHGMRDMVHASYRVTLNAEYGYNTGGPAPGLRTPEPVHLQPQPVNDRPVSDTNRALEGTMGQPLLDNNRALASESDDLEEARQPAQGGGAGSNEATPEPRRSWVWMAMLLFGILCLIVAPGLVLGLVTGQVQWGIALSGAICGISALFAGLYYYLHR